MLGREHYRSECIHLYPPDDYRIIKWILTKWCFLSGTPIFIMTLYEYNNKQLLSDGSVIIYLLLIIGYATVQKNLNKNNRHECD